MSFHEPGCRVHRVPQKNQQWCQDSPQDVPIQGKYWLQGLTLPSRRDKKADRTPVTSLIFSSWTSSTCMASICLGETSSGLLSLHPVFSWNRVALMEDWKTCSSSVKVPLQAPFAANCLHLMKIYCDVAMYDLLGITTYKQGRLGRNFLAREEILRQDIFSAAVWEWEVADGHRVF